MPSVKRKKSRKPVRSAKRRAKPARVHHPAEVALAYLVKSSPRASELLAKVMKSSPGAVELLWRSCDGAEGAPAAGKRVEACVTRLHEVLGKGARGRLSLDDVVPPASEASEVVSAVVSHVLGEIPLPQSEPASLPADPCPVDHDLVTELVKPL